MFIVITGLDGSGTSTVAENLHRMDKGSLLVRTPSIGYANREYIDSEVRKISQIAHYLYYLSSVVYMSEKIKREFDYKNKDVYCVRYLIDTVVSHNSAGLNIELEYEKYGILKPDLTIFITLNEETRQKRIKERPETQLDKLLNDPERRNAFYYNFSKFLDTNSTVYFNNENSDIESNVAKLFEEIQRRKESWMKNFY